MIHIVPKQHIVTFVTKFLCIILFLFQSSAYASDSLEKVSLQLNWKFQFEYAGFIAAKEKGFYEDVGLDVELLEYESGTKVVSDVMSQKVNYGIHNSNIVIANKKILPTTLLATYFHRSPLVFVTQKEITSPSQLIGKRLMATGSEFTNTNIGALLTHFNINHRNAEFVQHTFNSEAFMNNEVDVMTVFRTNEPYELDMNHKEYNVIDPADYGFISTAQNLYTSEKEALEHTERTQKFIQASNLGWQYAIDNSEEIIEIILQKYARQKSAEALRYEAKVTREMMLLDFFEIGETNEELAKRAVKQFIHGGILNSDQKLDHFLFTELISRESNNFFLTDSQKKYLKQKKEIRMCVDPEWMPFESIQNELHVGVAADVINKFQEKLSIPIRFVKTKSWNESILKAKERQCDIYSLASSTPDRLQYMDFTSPHVNIPIVMATQTNKVFVDNITSVKGRKLGIVRGYAIAEQLKREVNGINIVEVQSISEGLRKVESGELYGYIDNLMVIAHSIQRDFTGVLKISSRFKKDLHLSIGTRNDEPELHEIFEKLVKQLSQEELQSIYNKWVSVKQEVAIDYRLLMQILMVLALFATGFFYHYLKLRKLNSELFKLSTTDKLTGLFNRLRMDEVLTQYQAKKERYDFDACIILLDIDFFKKINDQFGHPVGDSVLVEFSKVLKNNVRETDFVGRWGGEEFLIACPGIDLDKAEVLANKLISKIRHHVFAKVKHVTASAGASVFTKQSSLEDVMYLADEALYDAKQNGRDQVKVK